MSDQPISQFPIIRHGALNEQSDRTVVQEVVEQIEGEVQLDRYVKAQTNAPQVVTRITDLENMIWKLCQEIDSRNPVVDEAKLLLKNRLEIDEAAHRFHSVLGKEQITDKHS
jgi:hypothetical protein